MSTFKIKTSWQNTFTKESYIRYHKTYVSGKQEINTSAAEDYSGNPNMTNPEELLAAALASCHMLTFLAISLKSGFLVESYDDEAWALLDKNDEGMLSITKITLHPQIKFKGDKLPDAEKIISMHEKAHKNCFIANSIKCLVEVK